MKKFLMKEPVLVISGIAAIISCFFVLPDAEYLGYIDFRVLALLFCLMCAVAGIQNTGFFERLSEKLLSGVNSTGGICFVLVVLTFFSSMLITNDVALITLVPFAIAVLKKANSRNLIIKTVVLQTVAANLGSMVTPVGNPQNLFLYSFYNLSMADFFMCISPFAVVSLILLSAAALLGRKQKLSFLPSSEQQLDKKRLAIYICLFCLSILTVLRIVPFVVTTIITVGVILITDRKILVQADYLLLLTFVFFFVFSGNLGRIQQVRMLLERLLLENTVLTGVLASQFISNVPAAVVLAPFTENWRDVLIGVNIGGLGTPIASLASVISVKLFINSISGKTGKYLFVFTIYNVVGLFLLLLLRWV